MYVRKNRSVGIAQTFQWPGGMLDGRTNIPEKTMASRPKLQTHLGSSSVHKGDNFPVDKKAEAWSWPLASTSYQD